MQGQPNQKKTRRRAPGLEARHSRSCRTHEGGACSCEPSIRAWVFDKRSGKKIRRTFSGRGAHSAAKQWRADYAAAVSRRTLTPQTSLTVADAATAWLDQIEKGEVLSRFRRPYAPGVVRQYRADFKNHINDVLGDDKLGHVTADDVQALIDTLVGEGLSGSRIRGVIVPLQALYRRHRRQVLSDPTDGLDLPEAGGRREHVVSPKDAFELLDALDAWAEGESDDETTVSSDRPLWATALLAGLRRGELQALRVSDLHGLDGEAAAWIHVQSSWDPVAGRKDPKSRAGVREVPMPETLRVILAEHVEATGRSGDELVFGRTGSDPFTPSLIRKRALKAWDEVKRPPTSHELRHTYSTWLDSAGISETRADRYMGHSDGSVQRRYRHQLEHQLQEDAERLEAWIPVAVEGKVVALPQAEVA
jgi:integrase